MIDNEYSVPAPLEWTCEWEIPRAKWERILGYVPIIGWAIIGSLRRFRYLEVLAEQRRIVSSRVDTASQWTDQRIYDEYGRRICQLLMDKFEWPNSEFLPSDSMMVLVTPPIEELELTEFFMGLEELYGYNPPDGECMELLECTLGAFVERLAEAVNGPETS